MFVHVPVATKVPDATVRLLTTTAVWPMQAIVPLVEHGSGISAGYCIGPVLVGAEYDCGNAAGATSSKRDRRSLFILVGNINCRSRYVRTADIGYRD